MRRQYFTIEVETQEKDGCGNKVPALSNGDIRRALMKGLPHFSSIVVSGGFYADSDEFNSRSDTDHILLGTV